MLRAEVTPGAVHVENVCQTLHTNNCHIFEVWSRERDIKLLGTNETADGVALAYVTSANYRTDTVTWVRISGFDAERWGIVTQVDPHVSRILAFRKAEVGSSIQLWPVGQGED